MEPSAETPTMTPPEEVSPPIAETPSETPSESPPDTPEDIVDAPEKKRDVSSSQQRRELGYITDTLLDRKAEVAILKHASGEDLTDGEQKLLELQSLGSNEEGDYIAEAPDGTTIDKSIPFTEGKPVFIEVSNGRKLQLLSITGRKTSERGTSYFTCQFRTDNKGTTIGRDIPVNEVVKAQYLSEALVITQDFSPSEQRLLNLQAGILRDGEPALTSQKSDEVNKLITTVSKEQGIITSSDIVSFLDSQADTIAPEQQVQLEQARVSLENINVLTDGSEFAEVLNTLGFSKDGLGAKIDLLNQELQALQVELAKNPSDQTLQEKITSMEANVAFWQPMQEQMSEDLNFDKYFESVRTGKVTIEQRQALTKAMREGDTDGMLASLIPELMDDPNDTPEQKAEKDAKRSEIASKLATGGLIGLGAILGIMWKVVSIESQEFKKSLR